MPRAAYSLRISFCIVPLSLSGETPCFSATAIYMASKTDAGALIVIEVDTLPRSMPSNRISMSASESDGYTDFAYFSFGDGIIGIIADLRRQIECAG